MPVRTTRAEPDELRGRSPWVGLELANLVVAATLLGLIATIQLVQYPLFALVGGGRVGALRSGAPTPHHLVIVAIAIV